MSTAHNLLTARIVYWGPAGSGKTESLAGLRRFLDPEDKFRLYSVASADGSTCFFDMLPLEDFKFGPYKLRVRIFSVPGAPEQAAMRRVLLAGADAVVFVADATEAAAEANLDSLAELEEALRSHGIDPAEIPMVWSFNKRDQPDAVPLTELSARFASRDVPAFETVAAQGSGVLESFGEIFRLLIEEFADRHDVADFDPAVATPGRLLPQLVRGAQAASRSRPKNGSGHLVIRLDPGGGRGVEEALRAQILMAEAHVELDSNSRMLSTRNRELMATNRIARSILSAMDTDNLLVVLLDATADYLQVTHASCVVFDSAAGGDLRSHVLGFGRDPVLGLRPAAASRFLELLASSDGPIPFHPDRNGDLLAELRQVDRRVTHAIFQPIKGNTGKPGGWVGVFGTEEDAHVGTQGLLFLSSISRFAALGLEKIAEFGALGGERDRLRDELTDRNGKLEMAQARVRALNRGLESRVSERTGMLEEANRTLRERSARAAQIARMRGMGKVAAAFAHEINNPLSGLASNLQYMQDNLDELRGWVASEGDGKGLEGLAEFDAVLEECCESAERIRGVIASLKRFGTEDEAPETLVLNAAVADAVTLLEERIRSAADLEVHLGTLPEIRGDSLELNHVVLALLTNAVEAIERTGKRGRISITTFATGGRVTLLLKDSGAGIAAEQLEKIFDPFFTTKEGEPGAGLGLHCAHQTIQRHGGTMRVRSVSGEGTKVTVEIPVGEKTTAETEPADQVRAE